ncbi:hypothetical protein EB34_01991 [Enterococcus faecalis]|nr:hypothetical protein EB34_01991 [Enterococcus faecalis]
MHLAAYQIILITIYAFIAINDSLISNTLTQPAIAGMISGMIMGDLKTGLMVGGTLQLMRLGIAAFGGASVPDYFTGAVLGTAFAVISGKRSGVWHWFSCSCFSVDVATRCSRPFL